MKTQKKLVVILAAAVLLSVSFPVSAAETDRMPEETGADPAPEITQEAPEQLSLTETAEEAEDDTDFPIPEEAPSFHAHIEFRMGYTVIGTFTDFTPDITLVQTLHSLDGENWQTGTEDWNLFQLGTDDEYKLKSLENQPCLLSNQEPLKNYIAGEIDRFYLKLRITRKNGLSYETQTAVIERGGPQPLPEGTARRARFSSSVAVSESAPGIPYGYRQYARYQLSVAADDTSGDVAALLPETIPVEIQLDNGPDFMAIGIVDCPVTWKPLSLPALSAGESITIPDAAEEILVPGGTLVSTPLGIFPLDDPLSLDTPPSTDEVRLILNVGAEAENPAGVLREGKEGLEMAFTSKPTGAVSIQAYTLSEGESEWTKLSGLSLLEEFNQPSTANSGYALLLRKDQEPYRSYLDAAEAGGTPAPFFVGLKIQGGIYDGKQLILSWPDVYDLLPDLPEVGGAQGNEGNAGANNKDDSTESGQRPNLPQISDDGQEAQQLDPGTDDTPETQQPDPGTDDTPETQQSNTDTGNTPESQQSNPNTDDTGQNLQAASPAQTAETVTATPENPDAPSTEKASSDYPSDRQEEQNPSGQRPNLPRLSSETAGTSAANHEVTPKPVPPVVQAAEKAEDTESLPASPDVESAVEHTAPEDGRRAHLLPAAIITAAICCTIAVVCRAKRPGLFHRITVKVRTIFHR